MLPSKIVTLSGHPITVFGPSDSDHYFTCVGDGLDPEYSYLVERNVAPDAMCVDIGANIGLKTVQLARLAPQGRVVSVEAGPGLYRCLSATVAANGLTNVETEHAAITDRDGGTIRFAENSAYGHISADGVEVPAMTLASVVARHGMPRLDFLKMDVEGFEFPILRSSAPLFAQHGTVVCFEFNSWCMLDLTDDHPRKCLEWLVTTFTETFVLRRTKPAGEQVERIGHGDFRSILVKNFMEDGHVSDIVVCMQAGRVQA